MLVDVKPKGQKNDISENMLMFNIVNVGQKDFKVIQIGLQVGRRKGVIINNPLGSVTLPYTLTPDQSCDFWTEYESIKSKIKKPFLYNKVKIKGYVKDYLGNAFYSKKMTILLKETWHYRWGQSIKKSKQTILSLLFP